MAGGAGSRRAPSEYLSRTSGRSRSSNVHSSSLAWSALAHTVAVAGRITPRPRRSRTPQWCHRLPANHGNTDRPVSLSVWPGEWCQRRPARSRRWKPPAERPFAQPTAADSAAHATSAAGGSRGRPGSVPDVMGTSEPRRTRGSTARWQPGCPRPAGPKDSEARERILTTAYGLFCRHGIGSVGVDTIIDQSGVAKMTLYRHFRSKDDLVLAVLERARSCGPRPGWSPRSGAGPATRPSACWRSSTCSRAGSVGGASRVPLRQRPPRDRGSEAPDPPGQPGAAGPHPVLPRRPGPRRRRARARALRPSVAHPHEGLDRRRGRGRRRRRPPGPGHGAAAPGPHARPACARRATLA